MHTTVSRHAAHLTVAVLLILLVGGCTGQDANQAATPQPAMTTAAPTTAAPTPTTVPPLTAKELAWLKALPKLDAKVAKALKGRLDLTIAKMRSLADAYRSCTRELLGANSQLRDGCRSGALGRTPPPVRVASPATESSCTSIRLALCNALFSANGSKTLKSQKALDRLERAAGREGARRGFLGIGQRSKGRDRTSRSARAQPAHRVEASRRDRRSGVLPELHRCRPAVGGVAGGRAGRCQLLQHLPTARPHPHRPRLRHRPLHRQLDRHEHPRPSATLAGRRAATTGGWA
jgi:hypothetical protein